MPELPEVDEAAARLRRAIVGKRVRLLRVLHPSLARRLPESVAKAITGADLAAAVQRVAGGDAVFSPLLAGFVLDAFGAAAGDVATGDDELDRLSAREREVMRLIARGYSYREVASELFISIKTVETHVSAVLRKLQLSSRHELTRWAAARRLI